MIHRRMRHFATSGLKTESPQVGCVFTMLAPPVTAMTAAAVLDFEVSHAQQGDGLRMTPAIFGYSEEDTRKVQTAVRGGPDGAVPEFLPYEKQAADQLRQKYGPHAFSCGVLLGGCGKLLTLRACDDKKSHFAHRPPVRCDRTARGESSADHLYVGEALSKWLRSQGLPNVDVQYVKQKNARSDAVEIRFGSKKKRRLIHVQMARRSFTEWQADGEGLVAPAGKPPTVRVYGPESQLAPFELGTTGHALRLRCETVNGTRVVQVGTHLPGHRVEWAALDQCRLGHAGIVTPWLEEAPYGMQQKGEDPSRSAVPSTGGERKLASAEGEPASAGTASVPVGPGAGPALPLQPGSVAFTGATLSSQQNGRSVYEADAQPVGSTLFRALVSLPASAVAPEPHHVYALTERAAVLGGPQSTGPASRWLLRAEGFARPAAAKAAEWVRDQGPKPSADPSLQSVRALLHDLETRRATLTTTELASALAEADRLCHGLVGSLPKAERKALGRWRGHLRHRPWEEKSGDAAVPADGTINSVQDAGRTTSRLEHDALPPLADRVRTVLQDAARAKTTVTWEDLHCRTRGKLPHLHPDDQGEILVMVDRDTPADEPLLSALVTGADLSPPGLYRHVRHSLGRRRVPDRSLEMHRRMDVLQLHQLWRHR